MAHGWLSNPMCSHNYSFPLLLSHLYSAWTKRQCTTLEYHKTYIDMFQQSLQFSFLPVYFSVYLCFIMDFDSLFHLWKSKFVTLQPLDEVISLLNPIFGKLYQEDRAATEFDIRTKQDRVTRRGNRETAKGCREGLNPATHRNKKVKSREGHWTAHLHFYTHILIGWRNCRCAFYITWGPAPTMNLWNHATGSR